MTEKPKNDDLLIFSGDMRALERKIAAAPKCCVCKAPILKGSVVKTPKGVRHVGCSWRPR